ncbi:MAG: DUF927 domain-containing protein [Anaeroplasma sp.]|nr:DUF927 domain-containing protein [Anaeroplasma sp.]
MSLNKKNISRALAMGTITKEAAKKLEYQLSVIDSFTQKRAKLNSLYSELDNYEENNDDGQNEDNIENVKNTINEINDSFTNEEYNFINMYDVCKNVSLKERKLNYVDQQGYSEVMCGMFVLFGVKSDYGKEPIRADFAYVGNGDIRIITDVPFEQLAYKRLPAVLKEYGITCRSIYIQKLSSYLEKLVVEYANSDYVEQTVCHDFVGFRNNINEIALYNYIGGTSKSKLIGEFVPFFEPKGNIDKYMAMLRNCVKTPAMQFALTLGYVSPVLYRLDNYNGVSNLLINLYGRSSTGKSIAAKLAMSAFCNPSDVNNPFFRDFFGTVKANIRRMTGTDGLLNVIDDTSTQGKTSKQLQEIAYMLDKGRADTVCDGHGGVTTPKTWKCLSLMTAERRILDGADILAGAKVRLCEITLNKWTTDEIEANEIQNTVLSNYALLGEKFMKYFIKKYPKTSKLVEKYNEIHTKVISLIDVKYKDQYTDREVNRLSTVLLTAEILNEFFVNGKYSYSLDLDALYGFVIENVIIPSYESRNTAHSLYERLTETLTLKAKLFETDTKPIAVSDRLTNYLGLAVQKPDRTEYYVSLKGKKYLEAEINNGAPFDASTLYEWSKNDWIGFKDSEKGRTYEVYKDIYGTSTRCIKVIVMKNTVAMIA